MSTRDTEVPEFLESAMPGASPDEMRQATEEFWLFFDALWAVADRIVTEREARRAARDKPA